MASTADSPDENSTTIKNNTFLDGGATSEGYALLSGQTGTSITHGIVVTGNTFEGNDGNSSGAGMAVIDTSGGLVSGNNFKGFAGTWVALTSGAVAAGFLGSTVSGWALVSNSFADLTATTDVALGAGTEGECGWPRSGLRWSTILAKMMSWRHLFISAFLPSTPIATGAQDLHQRQLETIQVERRRGVWLAEVWGHPVWVARPLRIRTCNLRLRRPLHYPVVLRAEYYC